MKRRDDAVDIVMQYCDVHEGGPLRGRPKQIGSKSTDPNTDLAGSPNIRDSLDKTTETTFSPRNELFRTAKEHLTDAPNPQVCFQCFVNEKLPDKIRCRMFYDARCVTQHFDALHLHKDSLKCNYCEVLLLHTMGFQRYASNVHRVESRLRQIS